MEEKQSIEYIKSVVLGTKIHVPSGKCPFKLEGTDIKSVKTWMREVQRAQKPGVKLETNAFRYWVRHTYGIFSLEYKEALKTIDLISSVK